MGLATMKIKGFFESSMVLIKSRKEIVFGITWTSALATIIAGKGTPPILESFLSILAFSLINLSVYIYNDVVDKEMDAYSEQEKKKGRPIAHGIVSEINAMRFVYLTGLLGLGLSFMLSRVVFRIGFVYYIVLLLYSYPSVRFKTRYVLKNLVTSLILPTAFLISGVAVENRISLSTSFLAFAYFVLGALLQPAIADMLDFEEDLAFNIKTIGNTISWKQNLILFNIGIIVILTSSAISYLLFNFRYFTPIILSLLGIPVMVYTYKLRNESGLTASYKLRPVGYAMVMATPLILALGTIF